jgi:hypothetical protein
MSLRTLIWKIFPRHSEQFKSRMLLFFCRNERSLQLEKKRTRLSVASFATIIPTHHLCFSSPQSSESSLRHWQLGIRWPRTLYEAACNLQVCHRMAVRTSSLDNTFNNRNKESGLTNNTRTSVPYDDFMRHMTFLIVFYTS